MFKLNKGERIILISVLIAISFILHKIIGYELVTVIFMLITTLIAGLPIFKKALGALKYKIIGIDALVTIAVTGAVIIGEFWEAAAVTYLFMLGDYLESRTIEKTRSSIKELLDLAPVKTRIILDGAEYIIPFEEVKKHDIVLVKNGEKISIDGKIINGEAYVNQANITGESIPIGKSKGDNVYSGTVIESGYLMIDAERVGEDTTFSRILNMVEEAQDKKAKTQKTIEKFARFYTPLIIVLAIALFIITQDINLALTLLVISCPGALVISTPVSIAAGLGNGAKKGILIKGGEIMEKLGKVKVLAFDKTGTLTIGKPVVTKIKAVDIKEEEVIRIAAIGETYSEHPLAKAIIDKAGQVNDVPTDAKIITGKGIKFNYNNSHYMIGNKRLFVEEEIDKHFDYISEEETKGQTVVLLGFTNKIIGIISINDKIRDNSKELMIKLKKMGIKKLVMLTGDNKLAAESISKDLNINEYYAGLLPEDKVNVIKELQEKYGRVGMVGDGVNDAPALAFADLGIAVGGAGKDVAMETADVVLMSQELKNISYAIGLSRKTVNNMKQNIYFAILVALSLLIGVLIETVDLSFGMLIHEISVLLVIINAARLLRFKLEN